MWLLEPLWGSLITSSQPCSKGGLLVDSVIHTAFPTLPGGAGNASTQVCRWERCRCWWALSPTAPRSREAGGNALMSTQLKPKAMLPQAQILSASLESWAGSGSVGSQTGDFNWCAVGNSIGALLGAAFSQGCIKILNPQQCERCRLCPPSFSWDTKSGSEAGTDLEWPIWPSWASSIAEPVFSLKKNTI